MLRAYTHDIYIYIKALHVSSNQTTLVSLLSAPLTLHSILPLLMLPGHFCCGFVLYKVSNAYIHLLSRSLAPVFCITIYGVMRTSANDKISSGVNLFFFFFFLCNCKIECVMSYLLFKRTIEYTYLYMLNIIIKS